MTGSEASSCAIKPDKTLENASPTHIFNYGESNLPDDPGKKKLFYRRGIRYHIIRTIRRTFFFEKLPPKFRCVLYLKLI